VTQEVGLRKFKLIWVAFLYFFSGIPFGFFYTFLPVYLRTQGIDLVSIGLLSGAGIFWSLKPLWAPLIDRYYEKRKWMALSLLGVGISLFFLSLLSPFSKLFLILLFFLTFFSALFDTALDGFLIEYIPQEALGKANGIRLTSYRIALIFAGGVFVSLSEYLEARYLLILLSSLVSISGFIVYFSSALEISEKQKQHLSFIEQYLTPIKEFLKRKGAFIILLFVATFKIGDALLGGMVYPFWVDQGFTRVEIGLISGVLGVFFTVLGSLLGGYYTSKLGLKKALFWFGLLQAFSNLGYTLSAHPLIFKKFIYIASILESFTGGLGTSAFLTFLTQLCRREFSSTQYALFSTLFSLTLTFSRTLSGLGAKTFGYFYFFLFTFFVALLPLLLIPSIFKKEASELKENS